MILHMGFGGLDGAAGAAGEAWQACIPPQAGERTQLHWVLHFERMMFTKDMAKCTKRVAQAVLGPEGEVETD